EEVGSRLVLVARSLNQGKAALIEDLLQARQPRVKPERNAGAVAADLQHLARRHGQRWPAAVVERIVVRDQHAEGVVAAAQIQDDEIADVRALRAREIGEELRRRKRHRERRYAAFG